MNQADIDQAAWAASLPKPPTLSPDEVTSRLVAAGVPEAKIEIFDGTYRMVKPEWIQGPLAKAFGDFLLRNSITYVEDNFDCNAFAMSISLVSRWCWAADSRGKKEGSALALGGVVIPGHMFCVGIHNEGVKFYEPQPSVPDGKAVFVPAIMREITPTRDELNACLKCLFI